MHAYTMIFDLVPFQTSPDPIGNILLVKCPYLEANLSNSTMPSYHIGERSHTIRI